MMSRNIGYLGAGVVLGAVLGVLICDDTKRRVREAIKNKANRLSDCASSSSKKVEEAVNNSLT